MFRCYSSIVYLFSYPFLRFCLSGSTFNWPFTAVNLKLLSFTFHSSTTSHLISLQCFDLLVAHHGGLAVEKNVAHDAGRIQYLIIVKVIDADKDVGADGRFEHQFAPVAPLPHHPLQGHVGFDALLRQSFGCLFFESRACVNRVPFECIVHVEPIAFIAVANLVNSFYMVSDFLLKVELFGLPSLLLRSSFASRQGLRHRIWWDWCKANLPVFRM